MSNTIQRDEKRVREVAEEVVALIAAEDRGEAETSVQGGSFEAEVHWLSRNMKVSRASLLRVAALMIEDIVMCAWDAEVDERRTTLGDQAMSNSINPYNTHEPYVWAGDYLIFRGKVVGMIEYEDRSDTLERWRGVQFIDNRRGRLIEDGSTYQRSTSRVGAMLRLQDWLGEMISQHTALDFFIAPPPIER